MNICWTLRLLTVNKIFDPQVYDELLITEEDNPTKAPHKQLLQAVRQHGNANAAKFVSIQCH